MRGLWIGLCLAAAAWAGTAARGEESALHSLLTADQGRGWEAVGRIDLGDRGFCTGALIAPDLVLTAAHCLYDSQSAALYPTESIRFLAGWRNGRAEAYRGVRRAMAHPDYVFASDDKMDRVAYDLALMELDQPIRLPSVKPFDVAPDPGAGDTVAVVSYALDRAEAPSMQDACHVLGRQPGFMVLTCNVDFGSSGAPIFSIRDGVAQIVSVVSAKAEMEGRDVSLATAMEVPLTELRAAFAAPSAVPKVRVLGGGGAGGAKFVRP